MYNLALYANYETTLFEVNIIFSPLLSIPSGWYKGGTHVHARSSRNCSGDQHYTAEEMAYGGYPCSGLKHELPSNIKADGYADKEFDFIYITAHNKLRDVSGLNNLHGKTFKVFRGEEIGLTGQDPKDPHVTALNITTEIDPSTGGTRQRRTDRNVDAVFDQWTYGNPTDAILNHPSYARVSQNVLLETITVNMEVHNDNKPSWKNEDFKERWTEAIDEDWYYGGIASDDAHQFNQIGKSWIVVKSSVYKADEITDAISYVMDDPTLYYSSTGPVIQDYTINTSLAKLRVEVETTDNNADYVRFKGTQSGVFEENLLTVYDQDANDQCATAGLICAEYSLPANVLWVRPVVVDTNQGSSWTAWLQPWGRDRP